MEPDDLLQEAFKRALDSRVCPADVSVVKFLAEAMRSIADGEHEKTKGKKFVSLDAQIGSDDAPKLVDDLDSAETQLISEERAARCKAIHADIVSLFDDDPIAKLVLEGMMEDMKADEIRDLTGLDKTSYDTKRKMIRRRIDKKFPQGWRP